MTRAPAKLRSLPVLSPALPRVAALSQALVLLLVLGPAGPGSPPGGERAASLRVAAGPVITASKPGVIAHRGASGHRPEHTMAAYRLAVRQGADHLEPDVVATRDGVLVVRHERELSTTTDVAARPALADRRTAKVVEGRQVTGWFVEDLTLAEVRRLRVVERRPAERPHNTAHDGRFRVPTLDQVLALARAESERLGREIGVVPETKHPGHFRSVGLALEPRLVAALRRHGLDGADAPVVVQSFEPGSLRDLGDRVDVPLVQLVGEREARRLDRSRDLARIASYADGVAVAKEAIIAHPDRGRRLVGMAHAHDLDVHAWTLRAEGGDLSSEVETLDEAGVDGIFTDHPDLVVAALAD